VIALQDETTPYQFALSAWDLPRPWRLTALRQGTNNDVQRVATPHGDFVLRLYRSTSPDLADRLRLEHTILAGLSAARLPFAVPMPISTATGELSVAITTQSGLVLATLTPFLPGEPPDQESLDQAVAAGEALAQLDGALAQLSLPDSRAAITWRSAGDLAHCHPLVPDPPAAIGALTLPDEARRRLVARYYWLGERLPALYARLPRQLLHEDADPSNILMEGARVTGILDFEFSALDVRPMELTVALTWWPAGCFGTGAEWPILAALANGYARHIRLTHPEIDAIPTLFEFRAYTSLIHRLGRSLAGLSPIEAVLERAYAALERADWLAANGEWLVRLLHDANR
jgi:Ser/Thr protein kinase RdoA (MazF antagonist)